MNTAYRCFGVILIVAGAFTAQRSLDGGQNQPPQSRTKSSQQTGRPAYRPTLGEAPDQPGSQNRVKLAGDLLVGPHHADINDAQRLLAIHSIFVERMDNGLGDNLRQKIKAAKALSVAPDLHHADAVLRGTCFDSARLKTVHSEVFLSTPKGVAIWQDIVRQPYRPAALRQAVATTADSIAADLIASLNVARAQ